MHGAVQLIYHTVVQNQKCSICKFII